MQGSPCAKCEALRIAQTAYVKFNAASASMDDVARGVRHLDAELDLVQDWADSAAEAADALGRLLKFYTAPTERHLHPVNGS